MGETPAGKQSRNHRLRMYAQEKATQGGTQLNVTNPFKPLRPLRFGANVFP